MPVDLSTLLADTLSARGYEVEDTPPVEGASGASYPVSLVAHRDGDRYLVDALASRAVRDEDVQAVASIVDDAGFDGALVMALEGAEHSDSAPGADRVEVWDRLDIDRAVGAYLVDRHLSEGIDPDEIGPSPVEPYNVSPDPPDASEPQQEPEAEPMAAPDTEEETPTREPEPTPSTGEIDPGTPPADPDEADPDAAPSHEPDASPDASPQAPATVADDEPPADEPSEETVDDPLEEDVGHRDLVDPEDMLERAERLMEQGAVDDGDAELIVEDDAPEPPQPSTETTPSQAEPEADEAEPEASPPTEAPASEPAPEPAEDGSDAEILEPDTGEPEPDRIQPDPEPPEPETASTARTTDPANGGSQPEPVQPSPAESPAAAAGPAREEPAFVSGTTIEPKVGEEEARIKAEEALFEAGEARLELLPFRVYRYSARLEGDGHEQDEEGRVWVSTQSGAVVRAPRGDRIEELGTPHERFQGSLSGPETQQAAREHLIDTLERRDELRQDYSESAVIERVRLRPDPDSLEVERLGKAYAPRWRVEGRNGTVFVDAVTGELVNE